MDFNKIVKKLSRKPGIAIDLEDIAEYVDPGFARGEAGKRDTYKTAYRLKSEGVLLPIRNGLYLVRPETAPSNSAQLDEIRFVEDAYWKIVKKIISKHCGAAYFIG